MVGVFVAHDPQADEWVCQIPFFPPFQSAKVRTRSMFSLCTGNILVGVRRVKSTRNAQGGALRLDCRQPRAESAQDRDPVHQQLGDARAGGSGLRERAPQRVSGGRLGAQVPARGGIRHEHRAAGRAQPRVEAGLCVAGASEREAVRQL